MADTQGWTPVTKALNLGAPQESLQDEQIQHAASMAGVPLGIARNLVQTESSGNPRAYNKSSGATGLTQLLPSTAKDLGVTDLYNPTDNLAAGMRYLAQQHKAFGSWGHALAAYNWGPGNVQAWLKKGGKFADLPAETRAYIRKIAPQEVSALARGPFRPPTSTSHLQMMGDRVSTQGWTPVKQAMTLPRIPHAAPTPPPNTQDWTPVHKATTVPTGGNAPLAPSQYSQWAQALEQHGLHGYAHVLRGIDDATSNPLSILNDVLGGAQRFVAGADTAKANETGAQRFLPPWMDPNAIGHGIYGTFHPNDPSVEGGLEHTLGADKLKVQNPQTLGGKIRNAAVDFGSQALTDPLVGLGATGELARGGETLIRGLSDAATNALLHHPNPKVRSLVASLIPHPQLRAGFTPSGRAIFKGVTNSEDTYAARQAAADAALLKKYQQGIAKGEVPPELEQRLLRDAYVYGTPEMRQQAIEHGYQPAPEEAAKPPEGVLHYNLKEDYFPHYGQRELPKDFTVAGQTTAARTPYAGFEQPQEGALRTDPLESMRLRLNNARSVIRHRMTQKRIAQETGLQAGEHGVVTDPAKMAQHVTNDTAAAYSAIDNPRPPEIAGIPFAKEVGDLGRDVMISTNPVPHAKNIGILSYLAGGTHGLMKGMQYAMSGVPKALADRLDRMGAGGHFMLTQPGNLSTARLVPGFIRKGTQGALERMDMGMRAARLEQLDREYGDKMSDFEKGERVNEDIGAYRDSPAYIQLLRNYMGAQFPQWHGYIVPTAVSRAILKHPERVESLIRAQDTSNQDILGNQGYSIEMGGPLEEFGQLTQAPGQMLAGKQPTYLTGPSMIGPVASSITHMGNQAQSYGPPGGTALQQIIPFYSVLAPQFGVNPYNSKAPPNVRSVAGFFAAYPKAKESATEQMIRTNMESGMSRFQAQRQAQKTWKALYRYLKP